MDHLSVPLNICSNLNVWLPGASLESGHLEYKRQEQGTGKDPEGLVSAAGAGRPKARHVLRVSRSGLMGEDEPEMLRLWSRSPSFGEGSAV